ncbi:type VI secretion system Vgr family protein [Chondromyces apiculatus]|uniref:VgrG protein n=1 Tax=Chondromyces apiculatus DSM 436 TaxID=1192034 RepID=A0A017SWS8_9BACT|nr:type VI secretion system tip protein TssI/VgrG [Chondromyces apiculatus]EYF01419.1 VgrG protein [Chondromyces apiculatus DSM 436]
MSTLELTLASGPRDITVRNFAVQETVSAPFEVSLWIRTRDHSLDLAGIVGQPATFTFVAGYANVAGGGARSWSGIVSFIEQSTALQDDEDESGLSIYYLRIVPQLWLLTQRSGNRIYQHLSIPDIVSSLLGEWGIGPQWRVDRGKYPKLNYKVQYRETDYDFMSRLLEEAGIAFTFAEEGSALIFGDRLQGNQPRAGKPIPFVDDPNEAAEQEFVSEIRMSREVKPGAHQVVDYDMRHPDFQLASDVPAVSGPEGRYEQYYYDAGSFFAETGRDEKTPIADDKGMARHDPKYGTELGTRDLEGERVGIREVAFRGNTYDVAPGAVISIAQHPHPEIPEGRGLLVVGCTIEGTDTGKFSMNSRALFADAPYRPQRRTRKPIIHGLQSATVVGPGGEEIHTDEFGRVRVQFPWDREGSQDDNSSCWVRVSQSWGGMGFGTVTLPRIGQEVLVAFLQGDPDQPMVVGRVYNAAQQVPYKLPQHKTRSTWKSDSSLGSNGFNEIMFEDLKGQELVWQQAQKNRDRIVNNDEFSTIVHDRQKLVKNDEKENTTNNRRSLVGKDKDIVTKKDKHERVHRDVHLVVKGNRNERIDGVQSFVVKKTRQEKVEGRDALSVGSDIHHLTGKDWVGEAADATLRGPGGFIRIDGGGVTISGTMVWINERGEPGKGAGSKPEFPEQQKKKKPEEEGGEGEGEGEGAAGGEGGSEGAGGDA